MESEYIELRLTSDDWNETKTINVSSMNPIEVEFHRAWVEKKRLTGRLMLAKESYRPSKSVFAHAWAQQPSPLIPLTLKPVIQPDGAFALTFDAATASLVVVDPERQRFGFAEHVPGDVPLELSMEPMSASYDGTLLDVNGRVMPGRTLEMSVKTSFNAPVASATTDGNGRFRFAHVPFNVPLQLNLRNRPDDPKYYLFDRDRMFSPGETRAHDRLKLERPAETSASSRPVVPLAKSLEIACRNAGSSRMRVLVAIEGSDSKGVVNVLDRLLNEDDERAKSIFCYQTVRVNATRAKNEAATIAQHGWPVPRDGEMTLIVLDGGGRTIATQQLAGANMSTAMETGGEFLNKYRPAPRDSLKILAEARALAKRSHRRLWIILGGPRCGPCFRLARWIEDHHSTLDKDYVFVKLMYELDDKVSEAIARLPLQEGDGIPWHAITEPDGAILAISRGPLGNIGFPSSVEALRHFQQMLERSVTRITPDEVKSLVRTLSPDA